jgi:hypothetical protein
MPDPDLKKYIFGVMEAINNLESFTAKITLDQLEHIEQKWQWRGRFRLLEKHYIKLIKLKRI